MEIELHGKYRNGLDQEVTITAEIDETELCHQAGFRFRDAQGNSYKPNGSWSFVRKKTPRDLVTPA